MASLFATKSFEPFIWLHHELMQLYIICSYSLLQLPQIEVRGQPLIILQIEKFLIKI